MSKRVSGPPRRPRNPVAKVVRTPAFRMQVVSDKRKQRSRHQARDEQNPDMEEEENTRPNIDEKTKE